jgi:hypothetical protein
MFFLRSERSLDIFDTAWLKSELLDGQLNALSNRQPGLVQISRMNMRLTTLALFNLGGSEIILILVLLFVLTVLAVGAFGLIYLIIAVLNCLQIPFGTALGVFTIIVLSRDSVRELYSRDDQ